MKQEGSLQLRKVLALVLAALLALSPLAALAGGLPADPCIISVQWTDGQGMTQFAQAVRVPYAGFEDCYWVQVPADAPLQGLTLQIMDTTGMYPRFSISSGSLLSFVTDAGTSLTTGTPVEIMAYTADGEPGACYYLYISTLAALPEAPGALDAPTEAPTEAPTAAPVMPVEIPVRYMCDGYEIASATVATLQEGSTPVYAQPFDLPEGYLLLGENVQYVLLTAEGASQYEVVFNYQYVAPTEAPTAIPTEAPVPAATITVSYLSMPEGLPVARDGVVTCEAGQRIVVFANPEGLLPGYTLVSAAEVEVFVDAFGTPSSPTVNFWYQYEAPATPAPTIAPAQVYIHYVDEAGNLIAAERTLRCEAGDTVIHADFSMIPDDYTLSSAETVVVTVDENGASPETVVFVCRYTPNVPAPKIALVSVKYIDPNGDIFLTATETCVQGMENAVRVDASKIPAGYELSGDSVVRVTVDENGVATPAEVIFQFKDEVNAYVTVRYLDSEGLEVAQAQQQLCYVGQNIVYADPQGLLPGYMMADEPQKTVTLSQDGQLNPAEVVFRFAYTATPSPVPGTPTPLPYQLEPMDAYCYPQNDGINFRSAPSTTENNVIGRVNRRDLAHILGRARNEKNEIWYYVALTDGTQGFLKETVVRILSDAEVAALFHYTPTPTAVPTPEPTQIPDGAVIDRWAYTNKGSVNFRKTPEITNTNKIRQLTRNSRVWVYSVQTVNGERWYAVRHNGTDGYLSAQYVDLMSAQESEEQQRSLASPMPTQTPQPTAAPTQTPTAVPTGAPTQEPTPVATATPAPYQGYALTRWQSALRTGASQTDETILSMVASDSLVYVTGQTYVNGAAWSSVQVVENNNLGFMMDEALMRISNEAARPYLDRIQAAQRTTATPVPEQQYGYAITIGNGVPMRSFPDTNGEILQLLSFSTVVSVRGQVYDGDTTWHMVQYNGMWGYIRQDQLRMLNEDESRAYEASLLNATPLPTVAPATPEPVTKDSASSYGHVRSSSGRVNMRSEPSRAAKRIRLLDNYAFALVLGTVQNDEGTWYHVSQAGTEGYISGDYFKVLTLGELTDFLQSQEYLNANSGSSSSGGNTSGNIQPVEDYNQSVWKNPALSASYEPFNPYVTATPNPEQLPTPTPVPTYTPLPTYTPVPLDVIGNLQTPAPTTKTSSFSWAWVLLVIAGIGGGGAYYAYTVYRRNERRRQAVREQQARQARRAQQPQMRAAQNNPGVSQATRAYNGQPYAPPRAAQNTGRMQPVREEDAAAYAQMSREPQATQAYRPTAQEPQATQAYRPTAQEPQATQAYRPTEGAEKPARQGVAPTTNPYRIVSRRQINEYEAGRQSAPETPAYRPTAEAPQPSTAETPQPRQRRSDRYKNQNNE